MSSSKSGLTKDTPRLSEMPANSGTERCARCCAARTDLQRWQEHNHFDQPELRAVVLCPACAGELIGPHPRLYRQVSPREFLPGSERVCGGCKHCVLNSCRSPAARLNGGSGLEFRPALAVAHVRKSGGGGSGWFQFQYEPVTWCSGKEAA